MKTNEHISRYEEIAYLIAKRIVSGDIKENDKLRGRSLLSSEYNVSSETVRKAMLLLSNHQVVDVKERSGIYVTSREHAKAYIKHFEHHEVRKSIAEETQLLLDQSLSINQKLQKKFKQIVSSYEKDVFPFVYFTCHINEDHPFLGHTLESLKIYDRAKGLITAYELDGTLYQIPNPKTTLKEHMTLYILGDKAVKEKVFTYFNQHI